MAEPRVATPARLDTRWLADHPRPRLDDHVDKNSRGRVLLVGGSRTVPGGLRLTAEAALRAGAGKVQIATIASAALGIGLLVPEAGVMPLPESDDGELGEAAARALIDEELEPAALVVGCAMTDGDAAEALLDALLDQPPSACALVIDAAAIGAVANCGDRLRDWPGPVLLTPNMGEMASLTGRTMDALRADRVGAARTLAARTGAILLLKDEQTVVAAPDGTALIYEGGGPGLATGGSGDVLAGILAGLVAQGGEALAAAGWAVWLHGEAGRRLTEQQGAIGFLARELPATIPGLLRATLA